MPEEVVKADKAKEKAHKKAKTLLNKVVIRKLPPNINESEFLQQIAPTEFNDFYFVPADFSLLADATSRAYIEFKSQEDIFLFKDKFDDYVFIDPLKGSEYPAVVEFAPFQGLPKARARKDKHVGTIESEPHFQNFLESLKEEEQKVGERKLEFTFQLKDDKKITSTPLLEFLAAAKEEKRELKKKKQEERKKHRDEERQKKKKEVAKNVPEPIKESKEEIVYDDGVVVRTVPSRLGPSRGEKNAAKKDPPKENASKADKEVAEKERKRDKQEKADERKIRQRERDEKRRLEREQQRAKEREAREKAKAEKKSENPTPVSEEPTKSSAQQQPAKKEVKRYSELRKARQEKTNEPQAAVESTKEVAAVGETEGETQLDLKENQFKNDEEDPRWKRIQDAREKRAQIPKKNDKKSKNENKSKTDNVEKSEEVPPKDVPASLTEDAKWKKIQEAREKRARDREERAQRERDERAARNIRNKDRPSMQIYRPKTRQEGKTDEKSSDEKSEKGGTRKRSDSIKSEKRERGDKKRKNSRDERRKRGGGRKGSSNDDEVANVSDDRKASEEKSQQDEENLPADSNEATLDAAIKIEINAMEKSEDILKEGDIDNQKSEIGHQDESEKIEEKLEKLSLEVPSEEKAADTEN